MIITKKIKVIVLTKQIVFHKIPLKLNKHVQKIETINIHYYITNINKS